MAAKPKKKIIFTGGGTGGSVTPLLAVAEALVRLNARPQDSFFSDHPKSVVPVCEWEFLFVGTRGGPEREMIRDFNEEVGPMRFIPLVSGKLRRYFSPANFVDIFKVFASWFVSLRLIGKEKPDLIISAGSFVSVPLVWAAALRRIPVVIHQADARPGLANRLMAPFARIVTVTFEKSLADFGAGAVYTGNPMRYFILDNEELENIKKKYNIIPGRPLILVTGGGTGAAAINRLVFKAATDLIRSYQVVHIAGKGKLPGGMEYPAHYQVYEFIPNREVVGLMALSDLIIARCGLAFLTELSALGRAAILVPIPHSHQEDNARIFADADAAVVLDQESLTAEKLAAEIGRTLSDRALVARLRTQSGEVIRPGAAESIARLIIDILR